MAGPQRELPQATIGSGTIGGDPRGEMLKRYTERLEGPLEMGLMTPQQRSEHITNLIGKTPGGGMPLQAYKRGLLANLMSSRPEDANIYEMQQRLMAAETREAEEAKAQMSLQEEGVWPAGAAAQEEAALMSLEMPSYELPMDTPLGVSPEGTPSESTEPSADADDANAARQLQASIPGLKFKDALLAIKKTRTGDGKSKTGDALTINTIGDVLTDLLGTNKDKAPFGVHTREGETTESRLEELHGRYREAGDDYDKTFQEWQASRKILTDKDSEYVDLLAEKELDKLLAEQFREKEKVAAAGIAEERHKDLDELYFGRKARRAVEGGGIGEPLPGVATGATEGIFQKMNNLVNDGIKDLQEKPKIDLWDFSDEDSWLGVNWKKTGLAIGGLAAMGGQIALSIAMEGKIPNFVMPLIMKAIEADLESQSRGLSERRLRAAGIGTLYTQLLAGYGDVKQAIDHAELAGLKVSAALVDQVAGRPIGKNRKDQLKYIKAAILTKAKEKEMGIYRNLQAATKEEAAFATDVEMRARNWQNAETQEDATKINAYVGLKNFLAAKNGNLPKLNTAAEKTIDEGIKSVNSIREIKRMASELFEMGLGPIEQIVKLSFKDLKKRFSEDDDKFQKIIQIMKKTGATVAQIAKAHDPRVSNFDIENWKGIVGNLEEESLASFIRGIYDIEYGTREAVISQLSGVYKTKAWGSYAPRIMMAFNKDADELMSDYFVSGAQRLKDSRPEPGRVRSPEQSKAEFRRINVGMAPIRTLGAPEFERDTFAAWASTQLHGRRAPRLRVTSGHGAEELSANPAIRRKQTTVYASPVSGQVVITSPFGDRSHEAKDLPPGARVDNHPGIDIAGNLGDDVYSATDGRVIEVGEHPGFGKYVKVEEIGTGNIHRYNHLSKNDIFKEGSRIGASIKLGEIGSTGVSSGPHLHWEIQAPNGASIDPTPYLGKGWITKAERDARKE